VTCIAKEFSCIQALVIYLLFFIFFQPTSPIKLKLGLQTGGRLLKINPPRTIKPSKPINNFVVPFTSLRNIIVCKNAGPKPWPLPPALATSCAKMLGQNHFVACWIYFQQLYIHI